MMLLSDILKLFLNSTCKPILDIIKHQDIMSRRPIKIKALMSILGEFFASA